MVQDSSVRGAGRLTYRKTMYACNAALLKITVSNVQGQTSVTHARVATVLFLEIVLKTGFDLLNIIILKLWGFQLALDMT